MAQRGWPTLLASVALTALVGGCAMMGETTHDVTVINSPHNPVQVTVVPPSGWEPFEHTASFTNAVDATVLTVPDERRLVIEFVSGFCATSENVPVHTVRLSGSVDHFLTPAVFPTAPGAAFAVFTQLTRIYANPAAVVKLAAFPNRSAATTTCSISISGHFETP
jgi:hypothetical protein